MERKKKRKNVFFRALYSIDEASFSERFSKIFPSKKKKKGLTFHYRISISSGKINFGSRNFPPFEEGEFFSLVLLRITDLPSSDGRGKKRISNSAQQLFPPVQVESRNHPIVDEERGWQLCINLYFPSPLVSASPRHEIPVFHDSNSWLFTLRLSPCPEEEEEEEIADPVRRRNLLDRP